MEAMTPGDYKQRGKGLEIGYGFHDSPFGECFIATTERGVCGLGFVEAGGRAEVLNDFRGRWPAAGFREAPDRTAALSAQIFTTGSSGTAQGKHPTLALAVPGTPFQIKVWQALLEIPPGALVTYNQIARRLGYEKSAARAVGGAVGANPVSWLIPCHRVIRETGAITGYHCGVRRKLAMIGWEATRRESGREGRAA